MFFNALWNLMKVRISVYALLIWRNKKRQKLNAKRSRMNVNIRVVVVNERVFCFKKLLVVNVPCKLYTGIWCVGYCAAFNFMFGCSLSISTWISIVSCFSFSCMLIVYSVFLVRIYFIQGLYRASVYFVDACCVPSS